MIADPDYIKAEFAVLVRSDLEVAGSDGPCSTRLHTRAETLEELCSAVFAENAIMLAICRDLGFDAATEPGDAGMRRLRLR